VRSDGAVERIMEQLRVLGKTQRWLSEQTGISERSISYWVQGRSMPSLRSIEVVARALGVPPGGLAYGAVDG
jgi:transcriptional regulator with XRE-family HTH domain